MYSAIADFNIESKSIRAVLQDSSSISFWPFLILYHSCSLYVHLACTGQLGFDVFLKV